MFEFKKRKYKTTKVKRDKIATKWNKMQRKRIESPFHIQSAQNLLAPESEFVKSSWKHVNTFFFTKPTVSQHLCGFVFQMEPFNAMKHIWESLGFGKQKLLQLFRSKSFHKQIMNIH